MRCCSRAQLRCCFVAFLCCALLSAVESQAPASKCYAIDSQYRLNDFSKWVGYELEYKISSDEDLTIRFCKDIQLRSSSGYVNYGRFQPARFVSGEASSTFIQDYSHGDLNGCEHNGFDEMGRTSQISLICGDCGKPCGDAFGCVCNYTSTKCSSTGVVAVKCAKNGPRVLKGFTVGFSPRGKEIVDDGIAQWGFESFHDDYKFATEQRSVSLYFTAPSSISTRVQKPSFTVSPSKGLTVKLSGSAANGNPPTTESPAVLGIEWQCDNPAGGPYAVKISVPASGFDPVVFHLAKECEHKQTYRKGGSSGWAAFGIFCLVLVAVTACCCCLGFCYNTRLENRAGLEAVPGFTYLARYLGTGNFTATSDGYRPAQDVSAPSSSKYGTV